jgi:hypothetical protein
MLFSSGSYVILLSKQKPTRDPVPPHLSVT